MTANKNNDASRLVPRTPYTPMEMIALLGDKFDELSRRNAQGTDPDRDFYREADRLTLIVQAMTELARGDYRQAQNTLSRCFVLWMHEPLFYNIGNDCLLLAHEKEANDGE